MRRLLAVLVLAFLPVTLSAQSNAERILNDHYTRSHDYDLVHQDIEVRDFDWDSLGFKGRVATTLVALRPAMDSVVLDAGALIHVSQVRGAAGKLDFSRHGDTLVVHLSHAADFGDTVRFSVTYDARISNGRGLTFLKGEGRPHRPDQIWSQGEDMNNHFWFPTYDFPNDKATWTLTAVVPARDMAVSNGRLVSNVAARGVRTVKWSEDRPASTYLVSLVVAPLVRIHDQWHGIPVDYYVYPEDSALARPLFRVTPDMIDTYSRLTGVAYPWQKYAQTTVADFFGGMENVSATTLVDWLPDARAYADRPWYQYILIPHELAHQWFGDLVTTENWANTWLNEGFAEFMPGQYWGTRLGAHAEQDYYADEYRQFMAIDHRKRMPLAAQGSNNIYPKGALVLEMLKGYLGPERFWASLHRYLTRNAYDNAVTDDLRQAVLDATGENLDWFFDEWIYQAGYP
ncbi:MAG TPA: M1 family metallopeptidase, partial [Gemmatimonadales bacterium]|nr:M1 family metallopeptidase [Gemmatimonadales bacterium]